MPEISRFFGIVIYMQAREHPPPHLHAKYAGEKFVFNILTGELSAGNPPAKVESRVREWIAMHRAELLLNWELLQERRSPQKIAPLD